MKACRRCTVQPATQLLPCDINKSVLILLTCVMCLCMYDMLCLFCVLRMCSFILMTFALIKEFKHTTKIPLGEHRHRECAVNVTLITISRIYIGPVMGVSAELGMLLQIGGN